MSTKVTVYGLKERTAGGWNRLEYESKEARDVQYDPTDGWRKYTVTRTVRAKGRPLWWAIRQLQEGRAVVDADGDTWYPTGVKHPDRSLFSLLQSVGCDGVSGSDDYAQSWTLAVPK